MAKPSLDEMLVRLEARLGPERLLDALRRNAELTPHAAAARALLAAFLRRRSSGGSEDALRPARDLIARGLLDQGVREIVRQLAAGAAAAPRLLAPAAAGVARGGWTLGVRSAGGKIRLGVRRRKGTRVLAELTLQLRVGAGADSVMSIQQEFRLKQTLRASASKVEREELRALSNALGLLFESLRGREGKSSVLAQVEAHETGGPIERILRVTFACNQRCLFCFVPPKGGRVDSAAIERERDEVAGQLGPRGTLTFSGGEATADPRLPAILESARRKGIRKFVMQTNGVTLARPGMIEKLVSLGVKGYDVSFHAHTEALYDRITGTRGQYPKAVAALGGLLARRECAVTACILINAWNYRRLPGHMRFLEALARKHGRSRKNPLQICFAMSNGAGINKAPFLAVDLRKVGLFLDRALEVCRSPVLKAQDFSGESSLPACITSRPDLYAAEGEFSQDRVRYAEDFSGETGNVGRAKLPACRRCPYDTHCLGVPAEYARMFGLDALRVPKKRRPTKAPGA